MSGDLSSLRGRRVLLTGGAGFIGSEVAHQLAALGAEVSIVDNLANGKRANVEKLLSQHHLWTVDIRNLEEMSKLIRGQELVLHLACLGVRHSIHSPLENHDVNATGTLRLLELARQAGVLRFVYVSSSEIYGTARTVPMSEQHPAWPHTVYGASKLAGERYAGAYWDTYRFPTVTVRPFNAYGPRSHHEGDSGEVIPKFLLRALAGKPLIIHGDGTQTRDFTYVSDTAEGILRAAASETAVGETINLGQGSEITINVLADIVRAIVGREDVPVQYGKPRPGDVLRLYSDSTKAAAVLGFKPQVSLADGVSRLMEWHLRSGTDPAELLAEEQAENWTRPTTTQSTQQA
jgi:UDP-glucose 4-epimerase